MVATECDFDAMAPRVRDALKSGLGGENFVGTERGYMGRVKVKVVSERLNGLTEEQKQVLLWDILRGALGADAGAVSLLVGYGTDEL